MGFGVQEDGSIRHCGYALVNMDPLDRREWENELRQSAGWPPLHTFTEGEKTVLRRRAEFRERRRAYWLRRREALARRRRQLGWFGDGLSLLVRYFWVAGGLAVGALAANFMTGALTQKLAVGFFAFWPGIVLGFVAGHLLGAVLLTVLKMEFRDRIDEWN